jgi:hypothetical protein
MKISPENKSERLDYTLNPVPIPGREIGWVVMHYNLVDKMILLHMMDLLGKFNKW